MSKHVKLFFIFILFISSPEAHAQKFISEAEMEKLAPSFPTTPSSMEFVKARPDPFERDKADCAALGASAGREISLTVYYSCMAGKGWKLVPSQGK